MAGAFTGSVICFVVMFTVKNLYRRRLVQGRVRRARHTIDFSFAEGANL